MATDTPPAKPPRRRTPIFRWRGLIPFALVCAAISAWWIVFGDRFVEGTGEEAMTSVLGARAELDQLHLSLAEGTLRVGALRIADPFDPQRNLVETDSIVAILERGPLLEKKIVFTRLAVGDVRFGTRRATPAEPVPEDGFAPQALREIRRWAATFRNPLHSLTPIDTVRALVLDPASLATVRVAKELAARADSVSGAVQAGYGALRIQETIDSTRAASERLRAIDFRALNPAQATQAVEDARRALRTVDSARQRVVALRDDVTRAASLLRSGVQDLDSTRRADYAFAKGLLGFPDLEGPQLGTAMLGDVSIGQFERALYWTRMAQQYMPAGLRPDPHAAPPRARMDGLTVRFPRLREYPAFLLREGSLSVTAGPAAKEGTYEATVLNLSSAPALVRDAIRIDVKPVRAPAGAPVVRVSGIIDHRTAVMRDSMSATVSSISLPGFSIGLLALDAQPGPGTASLSFGLNGERIAGRWTLATDSIAWIADAARASTAGQMEQVAQRLVAGIRALSLQADLSGTLANPSFSVSSNLDRVLRDRLRTMASEEMKKAEDRARAEVDRIVGEQTAAARAKAASVEADAQRLVDEGRARLDEERAKLDALIKNAVIPGAGGILGRIPGLPTGRGGQPAAP